MLIEWLMTLILATAPHWGPRDCAEGDTACVQQNEAKATQLNEIVEAIRAGDEREGIGDAVVVLSVIAQESSFLTEPCERLVPLAKIVERTPDPDRPERERIEWQCGSRTCARDAINIRTVGDKLNFWVCSAGEYGMMQLHPQGRWVRSGMTIPGTEIVLPRGPAERVRLVMDPKYNIALGCREMRSHREAYIAAHPGNEDVRWLDWIGRYNSGRDGNIGYTRRVARRYQQLCGVEIDTEGGPVPLRDVWEGCTEIDEYLSE